MRDSTTQGDRWMGALELASEFLPERKWYRELSKKSCEVSDVPSAVLPPMAATGEPCRTLGARVLLQSRSPLKGMLHRRSVAPQPLTA